MKRLLWKLGMGLALTAALPGCFAHARGEMVYDHPVTYVEDVPPRVERYPSTYYHGRPAYLVEGSWYYRHQDRWVVFRDEPVELRDYRVHRAPSYARGPQRYSDVAADRRADARRDAERHRNERLYAERRAAERRAEERRHEERRAEARRAEARRAEARRAEARRHEEQRERERRHAEQRERERRHAEQRVEQRRADERRAQRRGRVAERPKTQDAKKRDRNRHDRDERDERDDRRRVRD